MLQVHRKQAQIHCEKFIEHKGETLRSERQVVVYRSWVIEDQRSRKKVKRSLKDSKDVVWLDSYVGDQRRVIDRWEEKGWGLVAEGAQREWVEVSE